MSWPTSPDDPQGHSPTGDPGTPAEPEDLTAPQPAADPTAPFAPPATEPAAGQPVAPAPPGYAPPSGGYPAAPPTAPTAAVPGGYPPPGTQPGAPSGGYPVPGAEPGAPSGGYPPAGAQPGAPSGGFPAPGYPPSGGYPAPGYPPSSGGYPAAPGYPPGSGYPGYPGQTLQKQPGRKVLVAMVAVLALVAGAFAVVNLTSGGRSGAASPEDATTNFFSSLSDEDVVGMAEMVDPAERDAILPFVEDLESNLTRLGITSDIDLGDVNGLDLQVDGLTVQPQEIAPGIAQVDITGGTVSYATEPDAVPIGDALRNIIETSSGEPVSIEATADGGPINSGGEPFFLIATETDGRWHLSLAFTIAEYARRDAGMDMPAEGSGVAPQGASSPEAAVQEFLGALGELNLERMISLLPPDSMRALQTYAPLFLADAQESLDEFVAEEEFSFTTEGLEFDTTGVDGGTRVVPTSGTITMETYDGGFAFSIADGCIEMTGEVGDDFAEEYGDTHVCTGDMGEVGADLSPEERETLGEIGQIFADMEPGIVTVERDGAWYVDPLRSLSDLTIQMFTGIAPEDLQEGGVLFDLFTGDVFDDTVIYDDDEYDYDEDEEYGESGEDEDEGGSGSGSAGEVDPSMDSDAALAGYDTGYADGVEDGATGALYDPSGAYENVPPEFEGDAAFDYELGYYEGYDAGYYEG